MEIFRAVISGEVQGVGYRYFAIARARELNLSGYAKNLPTGQVEVAAAGERAALEKFLEALHEGPAHSTVTSVDAEWNRIEESLSGEFKIKY